MPQTDSSLGDVTFDRGELLCIVINQFRRQSTTAINPGTDKLTRCIIWSILSSIGCRRTGVDKMHHLIIDEKHLWINLVTRTVPSPIKLGWGITNSLYLKRHHRIVWWQCAVLLLIHLLAPNCTCPSIGGWILLQANISRAPGCGRAKLFALI